MLPAVYFSEVGLSAARRRCRQYTRPQVDQREGEEQLKVDVNEDDIVVEDLDSLPVDDDDGDEAEITPPSLLEEGEEEASSEQTKVEALLARSTAQIDSAWMIGQQNFAI